MSEELKYEEYEIIIAEGANKQKIMNMCDSIVFHYNDCPIMFCGKCNKYQYNKLKNSPNVLDIVPMSFIKSLEQDF